ncbi:type II toxin-antitoxin system RelE/ParE family toxin [Bacteroidales bacterium OttesenSCG-928-A17]|nr:type II toxin-antitoxin system RelE/ParE family toxin [Bacteroidales bacterium OttesenSCG-928-A17]
MAEIKWTNFAIENLNAIGEYIEKDSFRYAQIVVNYLFDSTEILENNPLAGRVVPEFGNNNIRELIRGNYRIVYRIVNEKRIDIIAVHHSARLLTKIPPID